MIISSYLSKETCDRITELAYFRSTGFGGIIANKPKYNAKRSLINRNAEKATEIMVLLGILFCQTMKTLIILLITPVLRLCFSKSGYLPKRIRNIRKDK